jgi:glycosyltransferase involved in cell wall biosynthesis
MTSRPVVSICLPSYNGGEFIGATVQSIINQSFDDFEIIIADDQSTDETVSVVQAFKDPRIRLLQNSRNLGMGGNWINVLSCARGRFVKLLGQDDLLGSECLSRQVSILEHPGNARVVVAVCNRTVVDSQNKIIHRRKIPVRPGTVSGAKLIQRCVRWGANLIGEPVVGLFRKEYLVESEMRPSMNSYYMDLALWAALLKKGDAFIDGDYLAAFRISRSSVTSRTGLRQAAHFRSFVHSLRQDPFFRINWFDMMLGCVASLPWCLLRNLFIMIYTTKDRAAKPLSQRRDHPLSPEAHLPVQGQFTKGSDPALKSYSTCSSL